MTLRFAVVHEAESDFHIATELADREMLAAIDWLDEHLIADQRQWIESAPVDRRLTWTNMKKLSTEAHIRPRHGYFDGEPGFPDAAAARRAIDYLLTTTPDLAGIVLMRDQDDQPERRLGLDQARAEPHRNANDHAVAVVVGLACAERECWVISGFDPQDQQEQARLDAERATLGFNPCERSHELNACKDDQAKRSPKRVLNVLTGGDRARERRCWMSPSLQRLRERGRENGLAAYLDEVRERLAPLISYVSPRPAS